MFEFALVPDACRRARKDGGLAQVLQRRTPAWGNRPKAADYVAESRWRSQPANVKKPEKSTLRRSKDWSHCTPLERGPRRLMPMSESEKKRRSGSSDLGHRRDWQGHRTQSEA